MGQKRRGLTAGWQQRLQRINTLLPARVPADMDQRPHALAVRGYKDRQKGRRHEERLLAAFLSAPDLPEWFQRIIEGTHDEDRAGIDAVLWTKDVGAIRLQVKSNRDHRRRFRKKHGENIIAIVITDTMTDAEIRNAVLVPASTVRGQRLARTVR